VGVGTSRSMAMPFTKRWGILQPRRGVVSIDMSCEGEERLRNWIFVDTAAWIADILTAVSHAAIRLHVLTTAILTSPRDGAGDMIEDPMADTLAC
jgi:hypothetical protein